MVAWFYSTFVIFIKRKSYKSEEWRLSRKGQTYKRWKKVKLYKEVWQKGFGLFSDRVQCDSGTRWQILELRNHVRKMGWILLRQRNTPVVWHHPVRRGQWNRNHISNVFPPLYFWGELYCHSFSTLNWKFPPNFPCITMPAGFHSSKTWHW